MLLQFLEHLDFRKSVHMPCGQPCLSGFIHFSGLQTCVLIQEPLFPHRITCHDMMSILQLGVQQSRSLGQRPGGLVTLPWLSLSHRFNIVPSQGAQNTFDRVSASADSPAFTYTASNEELCCITACTYSQAVYSSTCFYTWFGPQELLGP